MLPSETHVSEIAARLRRLLDLPDEWPRPPPRDPSDDEARGADKEAPGST